MSHDQRSEGLLQYNILQLLHQEEEQEEEEEANNGPFWALLLQQRKIISKCSFENNHTHTLVAIPRRKQLVK